MHVHKHAHNTFAVCTYGLNFLLLQDNEMHRGKPLYLNEERYAALTHMVRMLFLAFLNSLQIFLIIAQLFDMETKHLECWYLKHHLILKTTYTN